MKLTQNKKYYWTKICYIDFTGGGGGSNILGDREGHKCDSQISSTRGLIKYMFS